MPRIALYAHDTYGLGHLRRCLKLAGHLAHGIDGLQGLILSGSPWQSLFRPPAGFRLELLPPVVKTGPGRYVPRDSEVELDTVIAARRRILEGAVAAFQPHLFLVDNVPCGLRGEVLPLLRRLSGAGCRSVLVLRDVLDRPDAVRDEWERAGAGEALEELFDEIWIFGEEADAAALACDGLLAPVLGKVRVCGRLSPLNDGPPSAVEPSEPQPAAGRSHRVLVTGGGGGDAVPLVETYLEALAVFRPRASSRVVLGPDYPRRGGGGTGSVASNPATAVSVSGKSPIDLHRFHPSLPSAMCRADVVVAMAGYNTVCEILESGRPAVLVPRRYPREEQWLRALRWQREGRIELIDPSELSAQTLWSAVESALGRRPFPVVLGSGGGRATRRAHRLLGRAVAEVGR